MSDTYTFARLVLLIAGVGLVALLSNRLTERIKIPAPLLVLVAAAIAVKAIPDLHEPPGRLVERLVTVALICILFDGGLHMGWPKFRTAAAPIAVVGVLGTFLTAGGGGRVLPLHVRAVLVSGAAGRDRGLAHRSGGRVLRARSAGGPGPQRHDPGRRIRARTIRSGSR